MDTHVLIVEDDELVQSLLASHIGNAGYKVSCARDSKEMTATLDRETINAILLDLGLPDEDGLALTRRIRSRSSIPIIILTARKGRDDRITALEMGADDYLTKPFDPEELLLRLKNLLSRTKVSKEKDGEPGQGNEALKFAGFTLDLAGRSLTCGQGKDITISRAEFNLLMALAIAPGRVLSRDHLLDAIATSDESPSDRMIDVLIYRVRQKIEKNPKNPEIILTVPGCGYKFSGKVERT